MHKTVLWLCTAAALGVPGAAAAQQAAQPIHTFTGNASLVSDYRFRGISKTLGRPALQGGFDYAHASGFYAGNWNSNVSEVAGYPGANLEMDFYGGYKRAIGDLTLDAGLLEYYYPGSKASGSIGVPALSNPHAPGNTNTGAVRSTDFYLSGNFKWVTIKWWHALSDYFSVPDTKGTNYYDLSANYDIGGGWGLNGHIGHLKVHNFSEASYTDYQLGVTKDISGWVLGAALVSTNAKDNCGASGTQPYCFAKPTGGTYEGGKSTVLLSVGKTF
jgi:uncharacterized protein (TIGR02001 family)